MDGPWLEKFDLPRTPPLTRADSADYESDDEMFQQTEALVQATAHIQLSDEPECIWENPDDTDLDAPSSSTFFVDEPECYEEAKSPLALSFADHESLLVASPEAADFPWLGDNLAEGNTSVEPQNGHGLPTIGLVSSPFSAEFPSSGASGQTALNSELRRESRGCRRKALLIGIKYYRNPKYKSLKGPHYDVQEVRSLLQDVYGWSSESFRILKDDNSSADNQPTLENIRREIRNLVADAQPGDHLFFYFSGHGGQIDDLDGDEDDGKDEVIVSCDGKMLVDDELHDILVKPVPAGCHLTALVDCCSSGTSLDLPYKAATACDPVRKPLQQTRKHSNGNVVMLSACADAEKAYEKQDTEDKYRRVRGMLTRAFIESLKSRRKSTYDELLTSVRSQLRRKDTMQNPQLSSSRVIDMNDYFDL